MDCYTFYHSGYFWMTSPGQGIAPEGKCTRVNECRVAPKLDYALGGSRVRDPTPELIMSGIGCRVLGILLKRRELWYSDSYVIR